MSCAQDVSQNCCRDIFDVAIVGAGVAGLYSAYCCGLADIKFCVLDSLMQIGGQCSALYPSKKVYGVPGFVDSTALNFVEKLSEQVFDFSGRFSLGSTVKNISKDESGVFVIEIKNSMNELEYVFSRFLIVATGIGDMRPNIVGSIAGLSEVAQCSDFVQYYHNNLNLYQSKTVVVAGGGDSAVDFAIDVANFAQKVFIVHRRNKLTCEAFKMAILHKLVDSGKVEIKLEEFIVAVDDNEIACSVQTKSMIYYVDHIVFCYGFSASSGIVDGLQNLGIQTDGNIIDVDLNDMGTAVEKCYAVGDVARYANKKKNIVPCFFEADRAVRAIKTCMERSQ